LGAERPLLEAVLDDLLFKGASVKDLPAQPHPPDLVRREEAHAYPTDFNAMPGEWIDRLSLRGEKLTLCLARAYTPHLIVES
jgi:hypothetical protein